MSCSRCLNHQGYFANEKGGYEFCAVCRYNEYYNQTERLGIKEWIGWNMANGPIPDDLAAYFLSKGILVEKIEKPEIVVPTISTIGYKFIDYNLKSLHGNDKPWKLYNKFYLDNKKPLKPCHYGYHSSDKPYDAYSYVSTDVLMKVERLGDMIEDKGSNQKVVSRGLRPLAILWVGDIVSLYQDMVITSVQFDAIILKRLHAYTYNKGDGFRNLKDYANRLINKPKAIESIVKELDRFTKVKRG
jgi:hypothetical protein